MSTRETLRSDAVVRALEAALAGKPQELDRSLALASGLPGNEPNWRLAWGFANACAAAGARADALIERYVDLDADDAKGGTAFEFLPICGVFGAAARGRDDAARAWALEVLHHAADDLRYRVRESVPRALVALGERDADALAASLAPWMDGFFHAAAVVLALSERAVADGVKRPELVAERLTDAFALVSTAQRSAARFPGFKALQDALVLAGPRLATRFGAPVLAVLEQVAQDKDPKVRALVEAILAKIARTARTDDPARAKVKQALEGAEKPPRDPTLIRQGMRGRGKKRGHA